MLGRNRDSSHSAFELEDTHIELYSTMGPSRSIVCSDFPVFQVMVVLSSVSEILLALSVTELWPFPEASS